MRILPLLPVYHDFNTLYARHIHTRDEKKHEALYTLARIEKKRGKMVNAVICPILAGLSGKISGNMVVIFKKRSD